MLPSRQQIESALHRVRSGELSTADATRLLLHPTEDPTAEDLPADSCDEPLTSLVDRLGPPPEGIVNEWCEQLRTIAATHEHTTGEPLPSIRLTEFAVDRHGQLVWIGHRHDSTRNSASPQQTLRSPNMPRSLQHLDEFHHALIARGALVARGDVLSRDDVNAQRNVRVNEPATVGESVELDGAATRTIPHAKHDQPGKPHRGPAHDRRTHRPDKKPKIRFGRVVRFVLLLTAASAILAILFTISHPREEDRSGLIASEKHSNTPSPTAAATTTTPARPTAPRSSHERSPHEMPAVSANPSETPTLETLESIDPPSAMNSGPGIFDAGSLSLDTLMPTARSFSASNSKPRKREPGEPETIDRAATVAGSAAGSIDHVDGVADDSVMGNAIAMDDLGQESEPDESPQAVRLSQETALELPPMAHSDVATELWQKPTSELTLAFPFNVALTMTPKDRGWQINDARTDALVATIHRNESNTLLRWSESAGESAVASALSHGRLTDELGHIVYLRPLIEADPWPLRLDRPDSRPTWDLHQPIPPRATRLSLELDLPDGVELGWIEPIEPEAIRRTHSVAVLTPKESETVSLGMRFDIACARKLSLRIRFAARLDSAMPWQTVSRRSLNEFADALTDQITAVSHETSRLSAAYDRAGTEARRILRVKKDRAESLADSLRLQSKRTAELQSLIALVESTATVRLRVWVAWPDGEQTVMQMSGEPL